MPSLPCELAVDALESVRALPTASSLWQRLAGLVSRLDTEERAALLERIASLDLPEGEAHWFQVSLMASLTRDATWYVRQAALVNDAAMPDAIMQLLGIAWHHALVEMKGHEAFAGFLGALGARRLLSLVAEVLPRRLNPVAPAQTGFRRIALYTPQIVSDRHGGTTFMLNMASQLLGLGVEFCVFSAQEVTIPSAEAYVGGLETLVPVEINAASLKARVPGDFQIVVPNTAFSLRTRMKQVLGAIHAYQPDLVLFAGFMSPLAYRLYADYPLVAQSIHALQPLVPADVWLASDAEAPVVWDSLPTPQVSVFPFRFWPVGPAGGGAREEVAISADAVVLVTAGYRLAREIPPAWAVRMVALLDAHPEVHWLLVGIGDELELAPSLHHPRIRRLPPQDDLGRWLALGDIYANPPRMGGGGSVVMAMEQGTPVAAFKGTDGGDKVQPLAAATDDEYFALLEKWVVDPVQRQVAAQQCAALFATRLDASGEHARTLLVEACEAAVVSYSLRMENANA
jgi:glycosyltransferase involved in cell wall biosynthesis